MNKRIITILVLFILFLLQFVVATPIVFADCYKTTSGNNCTINYNSDKTKISSITVNFSYIDNVNLVGQNNSKRQYNLIFTKDSSKKKVTTAGQKRVSLKKLSEKLGITDAIYSQASIVGQQGVTYTALEYTRGDALCGTSIKRSKDKKCTLITGTYTITDRSVLGKFEPNTIYYGLLCSGFSDGSSSWYTNVAIDVQINENKSFVILDETTKPVITVTNNHNPARNGDILTAGTNADEITYNWYYDDDADGIPDEGTMLGSGETYSVKCPDVNNPTHDDTGHKIICVATQNKDENGNTLSEALKPKQTSLAVDVREKSKDISSTATALQKAGEVLIYDGKSKKPTIIVKDGNDKLEEGIDYDIQYVGVAPTRYGPTTTAPAEEGKYKAIIKFKGYCIGNDKEVEFSIGKPGSISIKESTSLSVNNVKLNEKEEELIEKIGFTEKEIAAKTNGKNILVYLEVEDISSNISKSDKEKIEAKLAENQKVGLYLDINLFKKIDGEEAVKITKTNGKVKVSFEIPEKILKSASNMKRTITVLKLHDGVVTEIEVEVNGKIGTFETDEFSTYALAYKDENISSNNPKTGDTIVTWIGLLIISIIGLTITVKFSRKSPFFTLIETFCNNKIKP